MGLSRVVPKLVFGFINLLVLGTVVAGMAGAVLLTARSWLASDGPKPSFLAVLAVVTGAIVLVFIARLRTPLSHRPAAWLLAGIVLSRVVYSAVVHQPRFSDFAIMWNYAESIATGPFRQPGGPGEYQAIVESRALPYLAPVAKLSGGRPLGYELANALAIGLCAFLAYALTSSLANRKAGLIALWLIALAPEPLMASEIPTHDIPGALFALLAVALGCLVLRWNHEGKRGGGLLGLGILLGFLFWMADFQRGIGPFLLAAMALCGLLLLAEKGNRRPGWTLATTLLLPLFVTALLNRTALPLVAGAAATQETAMAKWRWLAIYGNAESTGYWDLEGLLPLLRSLDRPEIRTFALARTASDAVDAGPARLRNYAKRIATLHRLGSQYHWYLDDTVDGRPWLPTALLDQSAGKRLSSFLRSYSETYRVAFLLLTILAVSGIVFLGRPETRFYLPLLVVAVLTLALGLLGEAQPRYLFPAWFLMPVYIGWFLTRGAGAGAGPAPAIRNRVSEIGLAAAIAAVAVLVMFAVLRRGLDAGWPRLVPTRQMFLEGGAQAQGRYRALLPGDALTAASAVLPASARVTAFPVRTIGARLPCSSTVRLGIDQRGISQTIIDSGAPAASLSADLPPPPDQKAKVSVHAGPGSVLPGCPVFLWMLSSGR